jgi:hypothetical protein
MKAHKFDMIAAWARENKLEGYEQYDPKWREKNRQRGIKHHNESLRQEDERKTHRR